MADQRFYLAVAQALSGCQVVEQQLKLYVAEAFELVAKCVGDRLPFKLSGDDYAEASLERLIQIFKKLSDNPELISRLGRFKEERNFLSHRAIASCMNPSYDLDEGSMMELQPRLQRIEEEATALHHAIHQEGQIMRAHLCFDDISSPAEGG